MRRLSNLLKKDIILGVKDIFILLEVAFAVLFVILLRFLIPDSIEVDQTVFIHDQTGMVERFAGQIAGETDEGETYVESREAVIAGMEENRTAVGLVVSRSSGALFEVEVLTQPYTPDAVSRFISLELEDLLSVFLSPTGLGYPTQVVDSVEVRALQEGLRDEIPFNQQLLPTVLLFMVGILGLFAMISLIGQERGDQTIRALRVSPAQLWQFLISKHLTVLVTGIATYSILYIPMLGLSGYLPSLLLMVLTIIFGSSVGAILGTYFKDPMASIGWVFVLMLVLGLPAVSLFAPVFSPPWLQIIPSYHTLFGLDAAMFPDNNGAVIWRSAAILAGFAAVFVVISTAVFTRRTAKEA